MSLDLSTVHQSTLLYNNQLFLSYRFTCGAGGTLRDILDQIMVKLSDRDSSQILGNLDVLGIIVRWIRDGDSVSLDRTNYNIMVSSNVLMGSLPNL